MLQLARVCLSFRIPPPVLRGGIRFVSVSRHSSAFLWSDSSDVFWGRDEHVHVRRWMSTSTRATKGDPESPTFDAQPALDEIGNAEAWREVVGLRRRAEVAVTRHECKAGNLPREVTVLINAATAKRMRELHEKGKSPSRASDLSEMLREDLRFTRVNGMVLQVFAEHAAELLLAGRFSANQIGEFLYWFSYCAQKETCNTKHWPCLRSFADRLVTYEQGTDRGYLLQGLVGAVRLQFISVSSSLERVSERYADRLCELTHLELCNVCELVSKSRFFYRLYVDVLMEFNARLTQVDVEICEWVLGCLRVRSPKATFEVMQAPLAAVDRHLGKDTTCISNGGLANFAVLLIKYDCVAEAIQFRNEFLRRWKCFWPSQFCPVLHYLVVRGLVDKGILEWLTQYLQHNMLDLRPGHVRALLISLCHESFSHTDSAGHLANMLGQQIMAFYFRQWITPILAVIYLDCLSRLQVHQSSSIKIIFFLIGIPIGKFCELGVKDICTFLTALARLEFKELYIDRVWSMMRRTVVRCSDFNEARWISEALVKLRLVEPRFLTKVADFMWNKVRDCFRTNQEKLPGEFALVLLNLSILRLPLPRLISNTNCFLAENPWKILSPVDVEELVNILWALAVHDFYPCIALTNLLSCEPWSIDLLDQGTIYRFHQLIVIAQYRFGISGSEPSTINAVRWRILTDLKRPLSADVVNVLTGMEEILCQGAVRSNVITADLFRISTALLVGADGKVLPWQDGPQQPSNQDVRRWRAEGCLPVAVLVLDSTFFALQSSYLLGPAYMLGRCLEESGWKVLVINSSEYCAADDCKDYLQKYLKHVGISSL